MATSKPVATISYNTEGFLKDKLNDLLKSEIISFWSYIKHLPDTDDKSKHIHLRLVLNKRVDLMKLQKEFIEPDPKNERPLQCMLFKHSEESDWVLYGEHNQLYLSCKNKIRNIEYTYNDFVVSDSQEFQLMYNSAIEYLHSVLARDYITETQIKNGTPLHELAYDGLINSKNAFRMKQYHDIYCKKINNDKFKELCERQKELENIISQYQESIEYYHLLCENPFQQKMSS